MQGHHNQDELEDFKHVVDVDQFRKLGYEVIDMICDYYSGLEQQVPVKSQVQVGGWLEGEVGMGWAARKILPRKDYP